MHEMSRPPRFPSPGRNSTTNKLLVAEQHWEEKSVCMRYLIMKTPSQLCKDPVSERQEVWQPQRPHWPPAGCGHSSEYIWIKLSFFGQINTFIFKRTMLSLRNTRFIAKTKAKRYYNYIKQISKQSRLVKTLCCIIFRTYTDFPLNLHN